MNDIRKLTLSALATALTAAPLLLLATPASASTRLVTNCNDSGPGSLRNRIAAAASGDTIDLSRLACTRIVLTSGQIEIPQNDLRLVGRSRYAMTIDGNQRDRVFWHRGTGTLRLVRLSVAYGSRDNLEEIEVGDAGGCILSESNVELRHARVHHCLVFVNGFLEAAGTAGGGIRAAGHVFAYDSSVFDNLQGYRGSGGGIAASDVTLYRSQVYNNTAYQGGGIAVGGRMKATYSIIQGNHASWAGGGIMVYGGPLTLRKTTVSGNVADGRLSYQQTMGGGGVFSWGGPNLVVDSTISGNLSEIDAAASFSRPATFLNSTVAYNVDRFEQDESVDHDCGGVLNAPSLHLESTIVARSTCEAPGLAPVDIGARTTSVMGHDNLIEHALVPVPSDTLTANPRLGSLAWNGGPTRTHKPAAGSPVLEHGNNVLDLKYDQRGPGFPRVKCGLPDIGAVERKCD